MEKKQKDYFYIDFMGRKKKGHYRCRVQLNGKRWNKYFNTKEEAESYRLEIQEKKRKVYKKGDFKYLSLGTLFHEWIDTQTHNLSSATVYNYSYCFEKVFKKHFEEWFHLIDRDLCESVLVKNGYSSFNCEKAFHVLNQINIFSTDKYKYSLDFQLVSLRKQIKVNRGNRQKPREYHTKEEIKKITEFLFNYTGDKYKNTIYHYHVYCLGLFLGSRAGELCSLKKINFNKESKSLLINSTITKNKKGLFCDSKLTKTKSSRLCQLSDNAIESIEWLINHSRSEYILGKPSNHYGTPFMDRRKISDYFKPILKELDIPWIGTHGMFRKTFATQIAKASTKSHRDMIASIQKQLGHKSPQMTLHYIQAIDTDLADELSKLDDLI